MVLRVVCAPDSFKESMTAPEAARAMAEGVLRAGPGVDCVCVPMADGGEGTARTLVDALGGELVETVCADALGRPRPAGCRGPRRGPHPPADVATRRSAGPAPVSPARRAGPRPG